jgi:hypothetical protein
LLLEHGAHAATCNAGSATSAAVVRTAEIAHSRRIIASCFKGLSSSNFTQALRGLNRAAVDERSGEPAARGSASTSRSPIPIV